MFLFESVSVLYHRHIDGDQLFICQLRHGLCSYLIGHGIPGFPAGDSDDIVLFYQSDRFQRHQLRIAWANAHAVCCAFHMEFSRFLPK